MAFLKSSAPGWRSAITCSASDHDKHNSTGDEYGSWHFDFSKAEGARAPRVLLAISAVGALLALGMNSSYTQADAAPQASQLSTPVAPESPAADGTTAVEASAESPRAEQLSSKIAELDAILLEKQKLEDALRTEKSELAAAQLQMANSKKLIRMEVDEFLGQSAERKRLDELLDEHKRNAEAVAAISGRVEALERTWAAST